MEGISGLFLSKLRMFHWYIHSLNESLTHNDKFYIEHDPILFKSVSSGVGNLPSSVSF